MASKGIGVTHYLILLCDVLVISALPAAAQDSKTTRTRTTTTTNLTPTSTRTVENDQKLRFDGKVSRVEGDVIGVIDSGGAETAVLLTPQTEIKSADKHHRFPFGVHHGSVADGRSALLVGLAVEVECRGNCAGQLVAEEIKYRCCDPCGCSRLEARVLGDLARLSDELAETTELASTAAKGAKS